MSHKRSAWWPQSAAHPTTSPFLSQLLSWGVALWRRVKKGSQEDPYSLHTAEATGSKPVTPTSQIDLLTPCDASCRQTVGRSRPERIARRGIGLGEEAQAAGASFRGPRAPARCQATSDTIGHGDLASHRARAHPAPASPWGADPETLATAHDPAARIGAFSICFKWVQGSDATGGCPTI